MSLPSNKHEIRLRKAGFLIIAGVDEVGCGALAGPVVAGAVCLGSSRIRGLNDSKKLSKKQREGLFDQIHARAFAVGIGVVSARDIDEIGIRPATYLAMKRAVEHLGQVDALLVDAWTIPNLDIPQEGITKGDQHSKSIAAASIVAKVTRDQMMAQYAEQYPGYGFDGHVGYGTAAHRQAIERLGPCDLHRRSFAPIALYY